VREISLLGTADLGYWQDALKDESVTLAERDGHAQFLIIAAAAKYMGLRFREVSFSLLIEAYQGTKFPGAYLWQAFNSQCFFAFCERTLFRTPYAHADVRVNCWPAQIQVNQANQPVFRVENRADNALQSREPLRVGEDGWSGPVLPRGTRRKKDSRLFFAKVSGNTRVYPFLPSDNLVLKPSQDSDLTQRLIDSHFACKEWIVREDAAHGKSKTYTREKAMAELITA
jgi:hypothetical protein